jgi:chromosomal replication initiation ATPase DnaA
MKIGYTNIQKVKKSIETIANLYGIEAKDFFSKTRTNRLVRPRQMICCILSDLGYTSQEIGELIGKDQSTVRYSVQAVKSWIKLTPRNMSEYNEIKKETLA